MMGNMMGYGLDPFHTLSPPRSVRCHPDLVKDTFTREENRMDGPGIGQEHTLWMKLRIVFCGVTLFT